MENKVSDEIICLKFKELNTAMTQIISSICEDSDQNQKNDERIGEMMNIFNLINDDIDRIKCEINNLIDEGTKLEQEQEEENSLEKKFKTRLTIREQSSKIVSNTPLVENQPTTVAFNKKDMKIILEHTKKENESIIKEIEVQEKNLNTVKENVNKILNNK